MRTLTLAEIQSLAGAPLEQIVEERALDAVIVAHGQGTRYAFDEGVLVVKPPIPANLREIGAESPTALKLAVALAVLAGREGIAVSTLGDLRVRHRFLQTFGDAAQLIADGGTQ